MVGARGWLVAAMVVLGLALAPVAAATPSNPLLSGSISGSNGSSSLSGAVSVAASGTHAYTTAYYAGQLTAVDFSNPASPFISGSSPASNSVLNASTVNISGGRAYVASKNRNGTNGSGINDDGTGNTLSIFDISTNPAVPTFMGSVTDTTKLFGAYGVAVSGNFAYVAAQGCIGGQPCPNGSAAGNSFEVVDVSNPAAPTIVASLANSALPAPWTGTNALYHACSVAISGHDAYVTAANSNRLTIIDISNPLAPVIVSSLQDSTNLDFPVDVAVKAMGPKNYAYVADQATPLGRIAVVDVTNPASPSVVASVTDLATLNGAYRIRVNGNFAYVSASSVATVTAIDISNPTVPVEAWHVTDAAHLNKTTGLDIDPTSQYLIASSPWLPSQSNQVFAPYSATADTGSISVIVLHPQAPANTARPSISGTATSGGQLTASNGTWTGVPAPTFAYQWSDCDVNGANCVAISGATSSSYTVRGSDAGSTLEVSVIGTNAVSFSLASSAPTAVVTAPPVNTGAPTISGAEPPNLGDRFTASTGTWTGTPAPTFAYQWSDCDPGGAHCQAIPGASTSAYTVQNSDQGSTLEVTVTGSNSVGSSSSTSAHTQVVAITPDITGLRQSTKTWRRGSKLAQITGAAGQDASGKRPPVGTTFSFMLNVPASLEFAFSEDSTGRKVKGGCHRKTVQDQGRPHCELDTGDGKLGFTAHQGLNKVSFQGRISHSRRLTPAPYDLTVTATAAGKGSTTRTIEFTIVI